MTWFLDAEGFVGLLSAMPSTRALDLPDLAGKTLLVVEDNDDHLELLSTFLEFCGAKVAVARNVDAALTYLRIAKFDMVISDLAMPGKDGLDLIRSVRASAGPERTVPAIAVTGFYEQYAGARAQGFDVFLQKPVKVDALASTLREFFPGR